MFDYPLDRLPFTKLRLARALFDPGLPAATICHAWDGKAAAGTIAVSTYTSRVKMIVVESGAAHVKRLGGRRAQCRRGFPRGIRRRASTGQCDRRRYRHRQYRLFCNSLFLSYCDL